MEDAETFWQLLQKSTLYVDKTEFALQIMKYPRSMLFAFPRRFCKTHICSMLDFLLSQDERWAQERETFRNDARFNECKVLNSAEFMEQHFGKHPVIFIQFEDPNVNPIDSFDDFEERMMEIMQNVFLRYDFVLKYFVDNLSSGSGADAYYIKQFEKVRDGCCEPRQFYSCLENLAVMYFRMTQKVLEQFNLWKEVYR